MDETEHDTAPCCGEDLHDWFQADQDLCDQCLCDEIEQMRKIGPQHQAFLELTNETYDGCTREQKLGVYIQHRPANVVAFLLELLERTHPEPVEDPDDAPNPS